MLMQFIMKKFVFTANDSFLLLRQTFKVPVTQKEISVERRRASGDNAATTEGLVKFKTEFKIH
jgi:hypothetical protein